MGGGVLKLLIFINFLTLLIQFFLLINFNNFLSASFLESLFNTNFAEGFEFLKVYLNIENLSYLIIFTFILFLILKIKIICKVGNKINIFFICLILIICIGNDLRRAYITNFSRYLNIPIVRFYKELFFNKEILVESLKMRNSYIKIANSHSKIKALENIKNIVLIIGESSRRSAYQDYGQRLNTTPNLLNIKNKIVFSDVIAPYSSTNPVMSVMLNFANLDNLKERKFYENLDIVNLFKLADYKTFWISNQDYISKWGNNAASVGIMSDFSYFSNKNKNSEDALNFSQYDGVLLPILDDLKLSDNNFISIHLLGNHGSYDDRYPKEFNKFKASDIKYDVKKKDYIAKYYNSILYTDYIIYKIYEKFQNDDTLIIYLSDHAESLYDDKTKSLLGHGISDKIIADIPFIILYSNSFKAKHKELLDKLVSSKDLAFMSDDLIHLICDIAGIKIAEFDSSKSPINKAYNKNRIRLFANEINYDNF